MSTQSINTTNTTNTTNMSDYYESKASLPYYSGIDINLEDDNDYLDNLITDFATYGNCCTNTGTRYISKCWKLIAWCI